MIDKRNYLVIVLNISDTQREKKKITGDRPFHYHRRSLSSL